MGKQKYLKDIESLFEKSPVVDTGSILRITKTRKNVKQYYKQLIRNLIFQGKIKKLVPGYYTKHESASLAAYCFKPAYLGLQDALSFHNLWEQETIPVIITARKARQGIRKVMSVNVLIRRINKKYMFGFEHYEQDKLYFPYSDIEKTFIDLAYFNEKLDSQTIKNFKEKINKKKLNCYLKVYPKRFRKKILNLIG